MSRPFYVATINAFHTVADDERIAVSIAVVWPFDGEDPHMLALTVAHGQFPESEGWSDHHVFVQQLDPFVIETILGEAGTLVPDALKGHVLTVIREVAD